MRVYVRGIEVGLTGYSHAQRTGAVEVDAFVIEDEGGWSGIVVDLTPEERDTFLHLCDSIEERMTALVTPVLVAEQGRG